MFMYLASPWHTVCLTVGQHSYPGGCALHIRLFQPTNRWKDRILLTRRDTEDRWRVPCPRASLFTNRHLSSCSAPLVPAHHRLCMGSATCQSHASTQACLTAFCTFYFVIIPLRHQNSQGVFPRLKKKTTTVAALEEGFYFTCLLINCHNNMNTFSFSLMHTAS